jgi:Predicted transcriptional regulators
MRDVRMYTVKEISEIVGLTTEHTIRYYIDKGLVPSIKRDKNNNRIFDEESINWLIGIKHLKSCGMSIDAIRDYVDLCLKGDSTIEERYDIILKQKEATDVQLKEITLRAEYLENKANHYMDIINNIIADNTNPSKWDKTPTKQHTA